MEVERDATIIKVVYSPDEDIRERRREYSFTMILMNL